MKGDVTVVGSINIDHTVVTPAFPAPGETILGESVSTSVGGKGANQAVAAALSGARVTMVGAVGTDADGDRALEALREAGVDTGDVRRSAASPTGTAWITVACGENQIVVVPGANGDLAAGLSLPSSSVTLCQLEIPVSVVEDVSSRSGTFVLNAAPAAPLGSQLLARCDVLVVNEHELAAIADTGVDTVGSVVAAAGRLLQSGVGAVITTLGSKGAVLCAQGGAYVVAAPAVDVVDSTGAGDAFCGVLAARLAVGDGLDEAVRWAVAAGSYAVRSPSAQPSYPSAAALREAVQDIAPVKELSS